MLRFVFILALVLPALAFSDEVAGQKPIKVFAAASLSGPLEQALAAWHGSDNTPIVVYGSSGALAQQIKNGSQADIYITAAIKWADWIEEQNIAVLCRSEFARNQLVLVAPKDWQGDINLDSDFLNSISPLRLVIANPDHAPAGQYTQQALEKMGLWKFYDQKTVRASDVRSTLAFAESGRGVSFVYNTDAKHSNYVNVVKRMVDVQPIYEILTLTKKGTELTRYLTSQGFKLFSEYGFFPAVGKHKIAGGKHKIAGGCSL